VLKKEGKTLKVVLISLVKGREDFEKLLDETGTTYGSN